MASYFSKLQSGSWRPTTTIHYDAYNPSNGAAHLRRMSLADLDYSPLKRVTGASFWMAVLVSMGGVSKYLSPVSMRNEDLVADGSV